MKKMIPFLLLLGLLSPVYAAKISVTIGTGALQPGTTAGFNVASGTVQNLSNVNQKSSGTYTISGGTFAFTNAVTTGTRFDLSTTTFRDAVFNGTAVNNSTTIYTGGLDLKLSNANINTTTGVLYLHSAAATFYRTIRFSGGVTTDQLIYSAPGEDVIHIGGTTGSATSDFATFATTGSAIKGTTTNNNALTGNYSEYISSYGAGTVSATTGVYGNVASIPLTAGDWDVSGVCGVEAVALVTRSICVVSLFSGNTTSDHVNGDNAVDSVLPSASSNGFASIPAWRVSTAGSTTVYLKVRNTFTGSTPLNDGRISVRRAR